MHDLAGRKTPPAGRACFVSVDASTRGAEKKRSQQAKGADYAQKTVAGTQHQGPESPIVTLALHASKIQGA